MFPEVKQNWFGFSLVGSGGSGLGGFGGPPIEGAPQNALAEPVKTPTTAEELQDDIPF
ncbi:hypothetical protein ACWAUC_10585 [Bradyrhizobium guangdongense]